MPLSPPALSLFLFQLCGAISSFCFYYHPQQNTHSFFSLSSLPYFLRTKSSPKRKPLFYWISTKRVEKRKKELNTPSNNTHTLFTVIYIILPSHLFHSQRNLPCFSTYKSEVMSSENHIVQFKLDKELIKKLMSSKKFVLDHKKNETTVSLVSKFLKDLQVYLTLAT